MTDLVVVAKGLQALFDNGIQAKVYCVDVSHLRKDSIRSVTKNKDYLL